MAGQQRDTATVNGIALPLNPIRPDQLLAPFRASLHPPRAHHLWTRQVHEIDIAETSMDLHPDLSSVPAWGFGTHGRAVSPGLLLEAAAGRAVLVNWRNRLPASVHPSDPKQPPARLPIATAVVAEGNPNDPAQNHLGAQDGIPENLAGVPVGWTTVHLHGAHSPSEWSPAWRTPTVAGPLDRAAVPRGAEEPGGHAFGHGGLETLSGLAHRLHSPRTATPDPDQSQLAERPGGPPERP